MHIKPERAEHGAPMLLVFSFRAKSECDSAVSPLPARLPLLSASSGLWRLVSGLRFLSFVMFKVS